MFFNVCLQCVFLIGSNLSISVSLEMCFSVGYNMDVFAPAGLPLEHG